MMGVTQAQEVSLPTLWTDRPDAMAGLADRFGARKIKDEDYDDLAHFIDHGWLIWRNAIEPDLIDALVKDVRGHHRHPGKFLTTDHRSKLSKLKLSGDQPDAYESLFDLYVNLESSRRICLHPRIVRFLSLAFDSAPVAFQQLLFQRSNGHDVHQDTSVVAVEEPCLLVATWIALEDVVEGAGELAFYDRSHKLPHILFKDGSKRINFGSDDSKAYARELEQACVQRGLAYERFMAKKGDVLFWTADLAHRSHQRTLPDGTSRLSCVTHYCPDTTTPFWFRHHEDKRHFADYGADAKLASMQYRLKDRKKGLIAPSSPMTY